MEKLNELEQQSSIESIEKVKFENKEIITDETATPLHDVGGGYVEFNNGLFKVDAIRDLRPDLFSAKADLNKTVSSTNFGTTFPRIAKKSDIFVRVDVLPNRVFKFDGKKWLEQNKDVSQSYLDNDYLEFLITKVNSGEYDIDQLTEAEKMELESYLKGTQNT